MKLSAVRSHNALIKKDSAGQLQPCIKRCISFNWLDKTKILNFPWDLGCQLLFLRCGEEELHSEQCQEFTMSTGDVFFPRLCRELHRYWINYADVWISTAIQHSYQSVDLTVSVSEDTSWHMLRHSGHTLTAFPRLSASPSSLLRTDRPLCEGTDEICMHVRLDYTCRLWEPALFGPGAGELSFQSTTSNKSHSLIGSGTNKIRGYIPWFLGEWEKTFSGGSSQKTNLVKPLHWIFRFITFPEMRTGLSSEWYVKRET